MSIEETKQTLKNKPNSIMCLKGVESIVYEDYIYFKYYDKEQDRMIESRMKVETLINFLKK